MVCSDHREGDARSRDASAEDGEQCPTARHFGGFQSA